MSIRIGGCDKPAECLGRNQGPEQCPQVRLELLLRCLRWCQARSELCSLGGQWVMKSKLAAVVAIGILLIVALGIYLSVRGSRGPQDFTHEATPGAGLPSASGQMQRAPVEPKGM